MVKEAFKSVTQKLSGRFNRQTFGSEDTGRRERGNGGEESHFLKDDVEHDHTSAAVASSPSSSSSVHGDHLRIPIILEICSLSRGNLLAILFVMLFLIAAMSTTLVEPPSVTTESKENHETELVTGKSSIVSDFTIPPSYVTDDDYWNVPVELEEKSTESLESKPEEDEETESKAKNNMKTPRPTNKNRNKHEDVEDEVALRHQPTREKKAKGPVNVTQANPKLGIPVANIWTFNISATMKAPVDKQVHPKLVFIKGLKVGGTSIAVALNQIAEQYNIKLATTPKGYQQMFSYDGDCGHGSLYFHHAWKAPWMDRW